MRIDTSVASGDPTLAALIPEGVTVAHIIQLFQTAYPINGEQLLRKRLSALGAARPADLGPPELAEFIKYLWGALKSAGIRDPAAVLARGVQLEAKEAAAKLGSSAEIGNIAAERKSAERAPVTIENNSSTISVASPPRPGTPRTVAYGTTKAEVLSRAKAAVDAGEGPRHTAERLAYAQEDFHTSQREIARAVGRSASWVNRLLEWRRSGYKEPSPFGPTTRAGRAADRNINNNDFGRGGGADGLLFGAAETGPNCETSSSRIREDGSDSGAASPVDRCSASYQPASLLENQRAERGRDGIVGGVKGEWVRSTPTAANGGQSGAILYLHGGAYCVGSPATYRAATARLARATGLPVFAADYRLAPEHQFPAAVDDAVAAYRSMSERRPVVIAGDSAGGGLAVATALAVRELQIGAPSALILFSPWVDLTTSMLSDKLSKHEVVLSCAWLSACAGHYLSGHDATTPLASPVYGDLHGLPPTLIQVGAGELLHSDAVRIYDALMNAGVTVRCEVVAGLWHGFHLHAGTLPAVDTAIERVAHFISGSIAPPVLAHAR